MTTRQNIRGAAAADRVMPGEFRDYHPDALATRPGHYGPSYGERNGVWRPCEAGAPVCESPRVTLVVTDDAEGGTRVEWHPLPRKDWGIFVFGRWGGGWRPFGLTDPHEWAAQAARAVSKYGYRVTYAVDALREES